VYHIKRDLNGVAQNCAHQAVRQSLSRPIFSCSCSHRNNPCPLASGVYSNLFVHRDLQYMLYIAYEFNEMWRLPL
jgi:hypothetical protein